MTNADTRTEDQIIQQAQQAQKEAKRVEQEAKKGKKQAEGQINIHDVEPVSYPSSNIVRTLSIAAAALSAATIATEAAVVILQQTSKTKREKSGLEGAIRMTIMVTLARAVPGILSEIRTINRERQRGH